MHYVDDPGSMMIRVLKYIEVQGGVDKVFEEMEEWEKQNPYKYTDMKKEDFVGNKESLYTSIAEAFPDYEKNFTDGVRVESDDFWFIVRGSNTADYVRVRIGGRDKEKYNEIYGKIKNCF